jgi:DNA invertase Pin-like site-specific DNA recombinase
LHGRESRAVTLGLIYVRQSRHKESERTVSPEVQEQACRQLPAIAACDEVEVYRDLDLSGKSVTNRPNFQRFLHRIETAHAAVVAVYDQSRSFRNTTEALDFYALMERLPTVAVVFHVGHFERSPVGEFSYTTLAAAHTMERKMTGAKIRSAYRYLNAQGSATGMPPYGYGRTAAGSLEPIDEEAVVVRRIFTMYRSGVWSAQAIAGRLNDEGIERRRPRSRHGWLPDTVVDTLRNITYIGKTYSESRAERRGEIIPGRWPAIVDEPTFWIVQQLMAERRVQRGAGERPYAFGRLLTCVQCGAVMRVTTTRGHAYYHCRRDVVQRCGSRPVREDVLNAWAAALFEAMEAIQPPDLQSAVAAARSRRSRPAGSVEQVEASLERLEKLFVWGHVSEGDYLERRRHLESLRAELSATQAPPRVQVAGLAGAWAQADAVGRRNLLGVFFEKLYIEDGTITKYVARREYREEVEALVGLAVGDGLEYEVGATGRGRNLTRQLRASYLSVGNGKGGIRTLEGASNPLPA